MKNLIAPLLIGLFAFPISPARAALSEPDKALIQAKNYLVNPGFEASTAGWAASAGALTATTTAANVDQGNATGSWAPTASSQILSSGYVSITSGSGLSGANGVVSCRFKSAGPVSSHVLQAYDGTNVLSSVTLTPNSTGFQRFSTNFIFPTSGTVRLQITSGASDTLYVDSCYMGLAEGFNLSAAVGINGSAWTTCSPTLSTSAGSYTIGNGSLSASCRQVGDSEEIQISIVHGSTTSIGTGRIQIVLPSGMTIDTTKISKPVFQESTLGHAFAFISGSALYSGMVIYDDSTHLSIAGPSTSDVWGSTIPATFNSSSFWSARFTVPLANASALISGQAYKPDVTPASWSGYHDKTCTWSGNSATFVTPSNPAAGCVLTQTNNRNFGTVTQVGSTTTTQPSIVLTPPKAGFYFACANVSGLGSGNVNETLSAQLTDGTNVIASGVTRNQTSGSTSINSVPLCGIWNVASVGSKTLTVQFANSGGGSYQMNASSGVGRAAIEWSIVQLDAAMPSPYLMGQVSSNTSDQERVERASVAISCTTATCTIGSQSGSWLTSITRASTGTYTANIATGMFSAAPVCTVISLQAATDPIGSTINSTTTGAINFQTWLATTGWTPFDAGFNILCMGPR